MYGGQSSFLPVKVAMSGVMPVIFASAILSIPSSFSFCQSTGGFWKSFFDAFSQTAGYTLLYFLLIIMFAYFYMSIQYNPLEMANNLRQSNGTIPGIRPGKPGGLSSQRSFQDYAHRRPVPRVRGAYPDHLQQPDRYARSDDGRNLGDHYRRRSA